MTRLFLLQSNNTVNVDKTKKNKNSYQKLSTYVQSYKHFKGKKPFLVSFNFISLFLFLQFVLRQVSKQQPPKAQEHPISKTKLKDCQLSD